MAELLEQIIGVYAPIPYDMGVSVLILDVPWICRFILLCIVLSAFIKGLFSIIRLV